MISFFSLFNLQQFHFFSLNLLLFYIFYQQLSQWTSVFCKIFKSTQTQIGAHGNFITKNIKIFLFHFSTNLVRLSSFVTYRQQPQIKMMLILLWQKAIPRQKINNTFQEQSLWETKKKQDSLGRKYLPKNKRKTIVPTQISLRQNSDKLQLKMIGSY